MTHTHMKPKFAPIFYVIFDGTSHWVGNCLELIGDPHNEECGAFANENKAINEAERLNKLI